MFLLSINTPIDNTALQKTSPSRTRQITSFLLRTPLPKKPRALLIGDTITLCPLPLRKASTTLCHPVRFSYVVMSKSCHATSEEEKPPTTLSEIENDFANTRVDSCRRT